MWSWAGRRVEAGEALASQLGAETSFVSCDVLVESNIAELIETALERLDRIDGLVNSAGDAGAMGSIATMDLRQLERTLGVHLGGTVAAMKHVAPIMVDQGSGSIVNVASIGGRTLVGQASRTPRRRLRSSRRRAVPRSNSASRACVRTPSRPVRC